MFNWIVRDTKQYLGPFNFIDYFETELFFTFKLRTYDKLNYLK